MKLLLNSDASVRLLSPPTRGRGLKHDPAADVGRDRGRPPRGGVD